MNYLEFKRQLMVDPHSNEPAFVAARNLDDRHRQAYEQAMHFEAGIEQALHVQVPHDLAETCMAKVYAADAQSADAHTTLPDASSLGNPVATLRQGWQWLPAMAAGLVLGIGLTASVFMLQQVGEQSISGYLASHWEDDGPDIISRSVLDPMEAGNIQRILATLNLDMNKDFSSQFVFAKNCPTPTGLGVHLVVMTEYGPATVIYIPSRSDYNAESFQVDGLQAQLVALQQGSVAILGNTQSIINSTADLIHKALQEKPGLDA